jgi:hypothetical protein
MTINFIKNIVDYIGWCWRWRWPKTVDDAIENFMLEDKNPTIVIDYIARLPESERDNFECNGSA